jgi:hypothetical protein
VSECVCACVCVCVCVCVRVCAVCDNALSPCILRRYSGGTGLLIKRTAKGAQVLFEDGVVAWVRDKGYSKAYGSWGTHAMPEELLVHVFSHLTQREMARVGEVCKRWCGAARSPTLWRDWDFYEITALSYRWVQRRFLSYGLFMKARGACARSLRLLARGYNMYATAPPDDDGASFKHVNVLGPIVPLSDKVADAKPLLWHLNHFFEGIDCTGLHTALLGLIDLIGPLSEIAPLARGAGSLRTLKLYMRDPMAMGDCFVLEFTKLNSLNIHSGRWGATDRSAQIVYEGGPGGKCFNTDLNRLLAACPRLRQLGIFETATNRAPPYALESKSVEVVHFEGKGLHNVIALNMPSLRHCTLDVWDCTDEGALPTTYVYGTKTQCSYNLFSSLRHLESVTVGNNMFYFPAPRGVRSTHNTAVVVPPSLDRGEFVAGLPLCVCALCVAADGEGAGAAQ